MTSFIESNMTFEFDAKKIFRIEEFKIVARLQRFKCCECVVRSDEYIDLIEAKTNAPNPNNKCNKQGIDIFFNKIEQKFVDSLLYTIGLTNKRRTDPSCPSNVCNVSLSSIKYRFYLIIKDIDTKYLPDQLSLVRKQLRHITKAWNIDDTCIKVLNEDEARNQRLIK